MNDHDIEEVLNRLAVGAEAYIGTPIGGLFVAAANAIEHLQMEGDPIGSDRR